MSPPNTAPTATGVAPQDILDFHEVTFIDPDVPKLVVSIDSDDVIKSLKQKVVEATGKHAINIQLVALEEKKWSCLFVDIDIEYNSTCRECVEVEYDSTCRECVQGSSSNGDKVVLDIPRSLLDLCDSEAYIPIKGYILTRYLQEQFDNSDNLRVVHINDTLEHSSTWELYNLNCDNSEKCCETCNTFDPFCLICESVKSRYNMLKDEDDIIDQNAIAHIRKLYDDLFS